MSKEEKTMEYVGKWKFHSIGSIDENDNLIYLNSEEYINSPMPYIDESDEEMVEDELNERKKMVGACLKICDDGNLYMLIPIPDDIPQEEINQAVSAGEIKIIDGAMADRPMRWELRDDEFWMDTGIEGEVFDDEEVDGWVKPIDEEGFLNLMNFRFVKED